MDEFVVGQEKAKRALSVAVYSHYIRIDSEEKVPKSNILLIGPSGSGKTLLAKTLAEYLEVPFYIADITSTTEAGYIGKDPEHIIQGLIRAANGNIALAERGIVYIDEIDKISRKSDSPVSGRDISGEGVQQALLKIIEGSEIPIPSLSEFEIKDKYINTDDILFIFGGVFPGIEHLVKNRVTHTSIGFEISTKEIKMDSFFVNSEDLIKYGFINEFIGRIPNIVQLNELNEKELLKALTMTKNSLVKQYTNLFAKSGIEIIFTNSALTEIAKRSYELGLGARGLQKILEEPINYLLYELIGSSKGKIIFDSIHLDKPELLLQETKQVSVSKLI